MYAQEKLHQAEGGELRLLQSRVAGQTADGGSAYTGMGGALRAALEVVSIR